MVTLPVMPPMLPVIPARLPTIVTGKVLPEMSTLPSVRISTLLTLILPTVILPTVALVRTNTWPESVLSSRACVMLRRYHGATSVGSGMAIVYYLVRVGTAQFRWLLDQNTADLILR
jgi:hypothetical protein